MLRCFTLAMAVLERMEIIRKFANTIRWVTFQAYKLFAWSAALLCATSNGSLSALDPSDPEQSPESPGPSAGPAGDGLSTRPVGRVNRGASGCRTRPKNILGKYLELNA